MDIKPIETFFDGYGFRSEQTYPLERIHADLIQLTRLREEMGLDAPDTVKRERAQAIYFGHPELPGDECELPIRQRALARRVPGFYPMYSPEIKQYVLSPSASFPSHQGEAIRRALCAIQLMDEQCCYRGKDGKPCQYAPDDRCANCQRPTCDTHLSCTMDEKFYCPDCFNHR